MALPGFFGVGIGTYDENKPREEDKGMGAPAFNPDDAWELVEGK